MTNTKRLNHHVMIPQVGLGVWQATNHQAETAVSAALELGYRLVDTASIYQNESGVGAGIAASKIPRDQLFITSKLWNSEQQEPLNAIEQSLKRLQLEYLDCYLIHWPAPALNQYVNAWRALIKAKESGLVKTIGVSNFEPEHINTLIKATGVIPAVNQIEKHPLFTQQKLTRWCQLQGIQVQAWSPLAQGNTELLCHPGLVEIADKHTKTVAQVILRWHLQKEVLVIPKSVSFHRIKENFQLFDFVLSVEDCRYIDNFNKDLRLGPNPFSFNN